MLVLALTPAGNDRLWLILNQEVRLDSLDNQASQGRQQVLGLLDSQPKNILLVAKPACAQVELRTYIHGTVRPYLYTDTMFWTSFVSR